MPTGPHVFISYIIFHILTATSSSHALELKEVLHYSTPTVKLLHTQAFFSLKDVLYPLI